MHQWGLHTQLACLSGAAGTPCLWYQVDGVIPAEVHLQQAVDCCLPKHLLSTLLSCCLPCFLSIVACRYKFLAHPTGFIVHRQHSRSSADKMYQAQKKGYERDVNAGKITADKPNNNLAGLTHRFRDKVTAEMKAGNYTALIDDGIRNCVQVLPWWKETRDQTERRQNQRLSLLRRFMHLLR